MKKVCILTIFVMAHVAEGAGFYDSLNGELIFSSGQFHQHRASRFDLDVSQKSSELNFIHNTDADRDVTQTTEEQKVSLALMHRLSRKVSAMGLKLTGGQKTFQSDAQLSDSDQLSNSQSEKTIQYGVLTPFLSMDLTNNLTFAVEVELLTEQVRGNFGERTQDSQTPVASLVAHGQFYELGVVARPLSRKIERESGERQRVMQSLTAHGRLAFGYKFIVGLAQTVESFEDTSQQESANVEQLASVEFFLSPDTKVEGFYGLKKYKQATIGESVAMESNKIGGSLVLRSEGSSSIFLSYSREIFPDSLTYNDFAIDGSVDKASVAFQMKM